MYAQFGTENTIIIFGILYMQYGTGNTIMIFGMLYTQPCTGKTKIIFGVHKSELCAWTADQTGCKNKYYFSLKWIHSSVELLQLDYLTGYVRSLILY